MPGNKAQERLQLHSRIPNHACQKIEAEVQLRTEFRPLKAPRAALGIELPQFPNAEAGAPDMHRAAE